MSESPSKNDEKTLDRGRNHQIYWKFGRRSFSAWNLIGVLEIKALKLYIKQLCLTNQWEDWGRIKIINGLGLPSNWVAFLNWKPSSIGHLFGINWGKCTELWPLIHWRLSLTQRLVGWLWHLISLHCYY
jgi:hypothetical protein